MNVAVLSYGATAARLILIDVSRSHAERWLEVPQASNLAIFPDHDAILVSYTDARDGSLRELLDVYRLDGTLRARTEMDCRAHFNMCPRWSTFLPSPDRELIYVYKARTLGHHLAEDFVCGFRLAEGAFTSWNFSVPECVAGWTSAAGRAHAQMLFVADGLEVGRLPDRDLEQKLAFWLGPEEGMGPHVSLGPRPRLHSDLGHARALLFAPEKPLSVVVCTDGLVHLIDPIEFRHLEIQRVAFGDDYAMPSFGARISRTGRFLYVGTATREARCRGLVERIIVHDLHKGALVAEWSLPIPFAHMELTADGKHLVGVSPESRELRAIDIETGVTETRLQFDDDPVYIVPSYHLPPTSPECLQ